MKHLPVFADLRSKRCLLIGGGIVAFRRASILLRCGAELTVVAPERCQEVQDLANAGRITVIDATYAEVAPELTDFWLVVAATSDRSVNQTIASDASTAARFCNVVDDPELCSFIMPAIIDRAPVTIAISTGGASPVLARWIKGRIESWLPARVGNFASFLQSQRERVSKALPDERYRRHFWQAAVDGDSAELAYAGRTDDADKAFRTLLSSWAEQKHSDEANESSGVAWIVGAGPGAPELLTIRGRQLLATADIVMYDRLVNPEILEYARRDAEFISVGKSPGKACTSQEQINTLLIEKVSEGNRVCRLKGGDPMIYGRVVEELDALVGAGLRFEIVPGITAVAGCAAYAGIPLTWRGVSQSVLIATGHTVSGQHVDIGAALASEQTIAIYMAAARSANMTRHLLDCGLPENTPAAIIENGTRPDQRVRRLTLGELANDTTVSVRSPALLLIGTAIAESKRFEWFGNSTLSCKLTEA